MQHNAPVNIVFTSHYIWVVPVTSGNLYSVLTILVLVIATGCIYLYRQSHSRLGSEGQKFSDIEIIW
jgi:hypothetical protein